MNIFQALQEDHAKQRQLADALIQTHGESPAREKIFAALKGELKSHAVAEERHFYVPLIEHDATQELARHGVAEHHEMDELIESLEEVPLSSPAWLAKAKELCELIHHHLDDEEQEFFDEAKGVLGTREQTQLAQAFQREKNHSLEVA